MGINIIPKPRSEKTLDGIFESSGLPRTAASNDADFESAFGVFTTQVLEAFPLLPNDAAVKITLKKTESEKPELYTLAIEPGAITVEAPTDTGAFCALQTLRQLVFTGWNGEKLVLPCVKIEDSPKFAWRGLMLDVSRHFFSVQSIKKILDALSLHHINTFHWHLTDDQGWRLPVDAYPRLIEIGSRRYENYSHQTQPLFYTHEQIKEVVEYAAKRRIEVVPEVDLPGHVMTLLSAYPEFGCVGSGYSVHLKFGVIEDVLCIGNKKLFEIVEAILDTLVSLFPSKYIHIGGDEVPTIRWKSCPKCQEFMKENGIKTESGLQTYFTQEFSKMVSAKGKIPIGWDEVLEAEDLPKELVVMSWRGKDGGEKASARGHRVIMSPANDGCYLDYQQVHAYEEPGQPWHPCTLEMSYNTNPTTKEMTEAQKEKVLGGQGNLWTELVPADKFAEYMLFPRICAIAEALWSAPLRDDGKDFADFKERLKPHQKRLGLLRLLYHDSNDSN